MTVPVRDAALSDPSLSNFSAACVAPAKRNMVEATARKREISFFMSPVRIADLIDDRYIVAYLCDSSALPFKR